MKNTRKEVEAKIAKLLSDRKSEIEGIREKIEELTKEVDAQAQAIKDATQVTNLEAYERAKSAKRQAEVALEMYHERLNQLKVNEYVTEAESDRVIDQLLDYREALKADYESKLQTSLPAIVELTEAFNQEWNATNDTIKQWEFKVRANYRTLDYHVTRTDSKTGEVLVDKSTEPVEVVNNTLSHRSQLGDLTSEYMRKVARQIC